MNHQEKNELSRRRLGKHGEARYLAEMWRHPDMTIQTKLEREPSGQSGQGQQKEGLRSFLNNCATDA